MQPVDTLPFIHCNYKADCSAFLFNPDHKKSHNVRGLNVSQGHRSSTSLMSFCEALATDALLQGVKEGVNRVKDAAFLKVQVPKPPRRYRAASNNFESPSGSIKMSVTEESCKYRSHCSAQHLRFKDVHSVVSRADLDFVALDVQALEQMKSPQSSQGFPYTDCKNDKKTVVIKMPSPTVCDIVRSGTDFDIKSKRCISDQRVTYDPHNIYNITEFPLEAASETLSNPVRSASASAHLSSYTPAPEVPPEMAPFLEEPLLLVGPKLEWEGHVNARKISSAKRRKRQPQQMTPQEQKKIARVVIGYTLAFFLLVIVTFYIVYFV